MLIEEPPKTALSDFIKNNHAAYYGKICELRTSVRQWLGYISETFPHYTRHTLEHSDEIVAQVSKLLFDNGVPSQPVVQISPIEAYILIVAAYLHDAGMVVANKEKLEILASDHWKKWTSDGEGGAKRWSEIQIFRSGDNPADETLKHFIADLQTRVLIAEYVRRVHHLRAADVIGRHQTLLGRFAFDDPVLQRTVSDVCVAHGLERYQLEDNDRFPERRDVSDNVVNVRFLAILIRLGDLLDMSYERACPLLLSAASPLPVDSLAHWTQYQRIHHRLTAPDRIEIHAQCETQEEHRLLYDWCTWIVDEVRNAKTVMARAKRHANWQVPVATFDSPEETIKIHPGTGASYIFSEWKFELNAEPVLRRLIYDVHDSPNTFIRELLQNALDASRCQMYLDLKDKSAKSPEFPTQAAESTREQYPVRIKLEHQQVVNPISGEVEQQQVLSVEDCGIGMDKDIFQRYFLQIGRSFYITDEFRKQFSFVPTSRFGIGFLAVFAVSDHVIVESFKRSSESGDGPLLLTLTGPRNYLLIKKGTRKDTGTRIAVSLQTPMAPGSLIRLVSEWCRRVEFPVIVDELGSETVVRAERREDFEYDMPTVTDEKMRLAVRAFPIDRYGVEGELYVFAVQHEKGESWCDWGWAQVHYPQIHPQAEQPPFPKNLTCIHGLAIKAEAPHRIQNMPMSARLDYRSDTYQPTLARDSSNLRSIWGEGLPDGSLAPEVASRWEEILEQHLETTPWARGEDAWRYKQGLIYYFPIPSFWDTVPETIRVHRAHTSSLISLAEARELPVVTVVIDVPFISTRKKLSDERQHREHDDISEGPSILTGSAPTIIAPDFVSIGTYCRVSMLTDRHVTAARWSSHGNQLEIDWSRGVVEDDWMYSDHINALGIIALPDRAAIGTAIHKATKSDMDCGLVNAEHPFIQWALRVKAVSVAGLYGLKLLQYDQLTTFVYDALMSQGEGQSLQYLANYIEKWREIPDLPTELYPPSFILTSGLFVVKRERT